MGLVTQEALEKHKHRHSYMLWKVFIYVSEKAQYAKHKYQGVTVQEVLIENHPNSSNLFSGRGSKGGSLNVLTELGFYYYYYYYSMFSWAVGHYWITEAHWSPFSSQFFSVSTGLPVPPTPMGRIHLPNTTVKTCFEYNRTFPVIAYLTPVLAQYRDILCNLKYDHTAAECPVNVGLAF